MNTEKRLWFVFFNDQLLVEKRDGELTVPYQDTPPTPIPEWTHIHELSLFDGEMFNAYSLSAPIPEDEHFAMIGLRASFDVLLHSQYLKAGKAQELIYWDKNSRFCPACGMPMNWHTSISKRCIGCGKEIWPTVATAIIVLITRGDEVLMVHAQIGRASCRERV